MDLQQRIQLMVQLGEYVQSNKEEWMEIKERASRENPWFSLQFVDIAVENIATAFLQEKKLTDWAAQYKVPEIQPAEKNIGVVMAGNIPLVGFHDFLCILLSGNTLHAKLSHSDSRLLQFIAKRLIAIEPSWKERIHFVEKLGIFL